MLRIVFIFFLFATSSACSQEIPLTAAEKATLDSMFNNDEFFKLLQEKKDSSYVQFDLGFSNGIFSIKNNSLNAEQATTSKIFYTPMAGYFHKSGFGISAGSYLATDSNRLKIFQYSVSPSYGYYAKKINFNVSYTRFIRGSPTGFNVNPYKNDLYANIVFRKIWLRPAVGAGYSSGRTKEYFDSVVSFTQTGSTLTIRDTITSRLSSFSLNAGISHTWEFKNLLQHNDEFEIQPGLYVNGSNQKLRVSHSRSLNNRRPLVQRLLKTAYGQGTSKESFSLQSIAFALGTAYAKGKFTLQPQLYLDYYLHDTESKKLSAIYSFVISYAF